MLSDPSWSAAPRAVELLLVSACIVQPIPCLQQSEVGKKPMELADCEGVPGTKGPRPHGN